jgi:hypothetical protein
MHIKNMKSFPVQYICSRRLKPEFQNTERNFYVIFVMTTNGLFKIHFSVVVL